MSPPEKFENGKLYGAAMRSETNHCVYDWILLRFLQIQSDFNRFQKDWILTWESENGRWWQLQSSEVKKRRKKKRTHLENWVRSEQPVRRLRRLKSNCSSFDVPADYPITRRSQLWSRQQSRQFPSPPATSFTSLQRRDPFSSARLRSSRLLPAYTHNQRSSLSLSLELYSLRPLKETLFTSTLDILI